MWQNPQSGDRQWKGTWRSYLQWCILSLKGLADRLRNVQSVSTISIEPKVNIKRNNVCIHNRLKFVFGQFLE